MANRYHSQNQVNSLADCNATNLPRGPPERLLTRKYERLREKDEDEPDSDNVIDFFSRKRDCSGKDE